MRIAQSNTMESTGGKESHLQKKKRKDFIEKVEFEIKPWKVVGFRQVDMVVEDF